MCTVVSSFTSSFLSPFESLCTRSPALGFWVFDVSSQTSQGECILRAKSMTWFMCKSKRFGPSLGVLLTLAIWIPFTIQANTWAVFVHYTTLSLAWQWDITCAWKQLDSVLHQVLILCPASPVSMHSRICTWFQVFLSGGGGEHSTLNHCHSVWLRRRVVPRGAQHSPGEQRRLLRSVWRSAFVKRVVGNAGDFLQIQRIWGVKFGLSHSSTDI